MTNPLPTIALLALALALAACTSGNDAAPALHLRPTAKVTLEMDPARTTNQPLPAPR